MSHWPPCRLFVRSGKNQSASLTPVVVNAFLAAGRALHFVHCHLALRARWADTGGVVTAALAGGLGQVPEVGGVARLNMASSTDAVPGRIFISYRREDAAYPAGWLFDRLVEQFGKDQIFKDVDSIRLGDDFVEVITAAVGSCSVLLAVIGERWLTINDEQGHGRLENPGDFVRLEIEVALGRGVRIIPILVGGARMPHADQLPASLAKLTYRHALELSPDRFGSEFRRLLTEIESALAEVPSRDDRTQEAVQVSEPYPAASSEPAQLPRASRKRTGSLLAQMSHGESVYAVAFSPDAALLATGANDPTGRVWSTATGGELARLDCDAFIEEVAFSPDGMLLALRTIDRTARLWQTGITVDQTGRARGMGTGRELRLQHGDFVGAMAFSPDGTLLATGCGDKMARFWETANGRELARMQHQESVSAVAFSPDGTLLATGSKETRLWSTATGQELARMEHEDWLTAVTFSPDGTLLATASQDRTARIWDVATSRELARLDHGGVVFTVVFSPDGTSVATASADSTARLWQTATGRELARLQHDSETTEAAFSPDGTLLATGSSDKTARLWQTATGRELARLQHGGYVEAVAFSPDGTMVATGSYEEGKARLWAV
jgi:WD40 repeat protein